jgi:hypothetical protein
MGAMAKVRPILTFTLLGVAMSSAVLGSAGHWRDDSIASVKEDSGFACGRQPSAVSRLSNAERMRKAMLLATAKDQGAGVQQTGDPIICENAGCVLDHTDVQTVCLRRTSSECGSPFNWSDDDFRKQRTRLYYRCIKPTGTVWRVGCNDWQDNGCCTDGVQSLPSCEGANGELPCGAGA